MTNHRPGGGLLLEICAASLEDVETADRCGADRIELNSAISLGGLTPSRGMLDLSLAATQLPVIAMCRPRSSGFCYTAGEYRTLLADVEGSLEAGSSGVAFGVLTADRQIDQARCREIVALCGPRDAVFHRAFDLTAQPREALRTLVDCGVTRVMTSGGRATANQGVEQIGMLVRQFGQQITVMAAGGIRPDNIAPLVAAGIDEIHAGPGRIRQDPSQPPGPVRFDGPRPENPASFRTLCGETVRQLACWRAGKDVKP